MRATTWHRVSTKFCMPQVAILFALAMMLAECSSVPAENPTEPVTPANYGKAIAGALKKFKDFSSYSNFQISSLRWVHAATTGWSWLICVRYDDRGITRFYSFFLEGDKVANARYDVGTDRCPAQQYVAFDVTTGTVGAPTPPALQPIY